MWEHIHTTQCDKPLQELHAEALTATAPKQKPGMIRYKDPEQTGNTTASHTRCTDLPEDRNNPCEKLKTGWDSLAAPEWKA